MAMLNNQRGDTSPFAVGKSQSDFKKKHVFIIYKWAMVTIIKEPKGDIGACLRAS